VLITGPGDATMDATPARSHGYPRLLDMRRAVQEQVQPAEPGGDHTPTRPGYTDPPRSDDDRSYPSSSDSARRPLSSLTASASPGRARTTMLVF
jgi:hypothetical protein